MEGNKTMVSSTSPSETFYVKLTQVLDSTGFNLIFNVRETSLNLYLLYLEVTKRGGFHQVALQNKWDEVVSALKLEGNNAMLSSRLEILYAILLYKFEKLYFSVSPKAIKEKKKRRGTPTGKSGYQIFLKQECARLKAHDPNIVGENVLRMAIDAWKKMSVENKQLYVEESKKMKKTINDGIQKRPRVSGDSNCVTSQPQTNYSFVNNAAANVAFEMTEKTFKNPFFPVDFDTY